MTIDIHSAAVDADFISHVTEIERPIAGIAALLAAVLAGADLNALIHPLVYAHEILRDDERVQQLFSSGIIGQLSFSDIFLGDPARESYYKYLIPELYGILHADEPFPKDVDILTYWKRRMSLGEIHSVAMCLICGCGIFLSDDGDSKVLARTVRQRTLGEIKVYSREEILAISQENANPKLPRKDRKAFSHAIKSH